MKNFNRFITAIILIILLSFTFACAPKGSAIDFSYFNTNIHIETYGKVISNQAETKLRNIFSALESEFDIDNQNSLTYKFNSASIGEKFSLTDNGVKVVKAALDGYVFSDGCYDPSIYPLVKLWQFSPNYPVINFSVPSESDILSQLERVNFSSVLLDQTAKTLTKTNANTLIDFGGIVKGYATDMAYEILSSLGYTDGYINIGGSSLTLLNAPSLGIRHPRPTENIPNIITVNTKNKIGLSVSTSGDYQKYYVKDGISYSHIINPFDGKPSQTGIQSVTILGANGAFSDAITTATCLKEYSPENHSSSPLTLFIKKIINAYPNASVFAVYDKGNQKRIITNEKESESFTLHDQTYSIYNV
ncbi:MAG: FAD:protein FMN transferase [Clostridia bacterium]|nr:FAD:protein FMN transferase [Clostridia bacterium]